MGAVPHGKPALIAEVPELPPGSMVVLASAEPISYVVPSVPPDMQVVSLLYSLLQLAPDRNQLQQLASERVDSHHGPLWLLMPDQLEREKDSNGRLMSSALAELGYASNMGKCLYVRAGIGPEFRLCPWSVSLDGTEIMVRCNFDDMLCRSTLMMRIVLAPGLSECATIGEIVEAVGRNEIITSRIDRDQSSEIIRCHSLFQRARHYSGNC